MAGSREVCELFIRSGADITLKSKSGYPPLQIAAWKGDKQVCQLLIETGSHSNYYSSILSGTEVIVVTGSWTQFFQQVYL